MDIFKHHNTTGIVPNIMPGRNIQAMGGPCGGGKCGKCSGGSHRCSSSTGKCGGRCASKCSSGGGGPSR